MESIDFVGFKDVIGYPSYSIFEKIFLHKKKLFNIYYLPTNVRRFFASKCLQNP